MTSEARERGRPPAHGDEVGLALTRLALERTVLGYVRTGLAFLVAGVSLIRFFDHDAYEATGFALVGLGLLVFALGWRCARAWNRRIAALDPGPR